MPASIAVLAARSAWARVRNTATTVCPNPEPRAGSRKFRSGRWEATAHHLLA